LANNPSATKILVKNLMALIKERMPVIQQAYDDFPAANQQLVFPCFSIFTQDPVFTPGQPYVIAKGAKITTGRDAGKYPVNYVIGQWNFSLQVDFWCESKAQRHQIHEDFVQAFNDISPSAGVTVDMVDYYGECCHATFGKSSFSEDSEISSQRNEWRFKIDLSTTVRCIKQKMEFLMETIEYTTEATEGGIQSSSSGTGYTNGTI